MTSVDELALAFAADSAPPPEVLDMSDADYTPPTLTTEQLVYYNSPALYCLAYGERFSGKTYVAAHKLVRHVFHHWNALAVIVVGVRRQGTDGGILHTIMNEILPEWAANVPGFEHSEMKLDSASKDAYVWVKSRMGCWGQIKLVSVPHGTNLAERFRGTAPSYIHVEELTMMPNEGYFTVLMQQLGRRPHIPYAAQQYVCTANPEGPSHFVYKHFFINPKKEDGTTDPNYAAIHLPIHSNPDPRAQDYFLKVKDATKHDPVEYQRLVLGVWVERESGTAIFVNHFDRNIHVKGDFAKREFLVPKRGTPITVGLDIGDVNHGIAFLQDRSTDEKRIWMAFDEIAVTGQNVSLDQLVPSIMDKCQYWGDTLDYDFTFQFISDKSAFNRFRSASGSYDHLMVERLSRELKEQQPARYSRLRKPIKLIECPKPPGSVAARIKVMMNLLAREEFYVSAKCVRMIEMLAKMESEEDEPFVPSRKGGHIHIHDATTYALYYHALGKPVSIESEVAMPAFLRLGSN